tara:strand:- start:251 stop:547 length:297 start_codon:yes stop_codon:yes gene_type:complete
MKKQINVDAISNEFSAQSSFFKEARAVKEGRAKTRPQSKGKSSSGEDEREKKKMTLDLYMDQYLSLSDIKTKRIRDGETKSLVDFIREAVDDYIAKHR